MALHANNNTEERDRISEQYYNDLKHVEILSRDVEKELFVRYKKHHDIVARDRIIKSSLRFVVFLAKKQNVFNNQETFKEAVSAGNLGLMLALDRFDPEKGIRFLSYAAHWVMLCIRTEQYRKPLIRVPANKRRTSQLVNQERQRMLAQFGEICESTLAGTVGITPKKLLRMHDESLHRINSTDEVIVPDSDLRETTIEKNTTSVVRSMLHALDGKERFIIKNYFGIGIDKRSLSQIGGILGLTPERVRQIKLIALKRLCRRARQVQKLSTSADVLV